MSAVYDNWERLVTATLRREQLRQIALRTPSDISSASLVSSSSFNFAAPSTRVLSLNTSSCLPLVGKSFTYDQILLATDNFSESNFIKHGRSGDLFRGVLECGLEVVVKRNVEARSILVDENFEARIGRLTEVCTEEKVKDQNRILRLLRLSKASEGGAAGSSNTTSAYDVYCFGKILLELVTGYPGFGHHNDPIINGWTDNVLSYINTYDKELVKNIVDPSLTVDEDLLIEVWVAAIVGKACLNPRHSKRPQMKHILEALKDPKSVRFSTSVSPWLIGQFGTLSKTRVTEGMTGIGTSQANTNAASKGEKAYPIGDIVNLPKVRTYTFPELVVATKNFRSDKLLGNGEFGRVYKGWIQDKSTSEGETQSLVAIKRWNAESFEGIEQCMHEIWMRGMLTHPNLIKLHGYCWRNGEVFIVSEYMQKGSFQNHLYGRGSSVQPLQWNVRLKILIGAGRALAFLHALKKPVIYRDFKPSSILLDGDRSDVSTLVIGTYGYAAPEYIAAGKSFIHPLSFLLVKMAVVEAKSSILWLTSSLSKIPTEKIKSYVAEFLDVTGHLYVKSDVYAFGVVLAEVLTGLRALDTNRLQGQHTLADWIKLRLYDERMIYSIMDPRLEGKYPTLAAAEMAHLTLRCLASDPKARPSMKEVVDALEHIASAK